MPSKKPNSSPQKAWRWSDATPAAKEVFCKGMFERFQQIVEPHLLAQGGTFSEIGMMWLDFARSLQDVVTEALPELAMMDAMSELGLSSEHTPVIDRDAEGDN